MTDDPLYQAHGISGSLLCWRDRVVIRKKGWPYGTKSDKSVPIRSIGAVQFKQPGLTAGFLQIAYSGSSENKGGVFNASTDENTVVFAKKDLYAFQTVKGFIEFQQKQIAEPSTPTASAAPASLADELTKLASLRDQGVLTPEEFDAQKARLLG